MLFANLRVWFEQRTRWEKAAMTIWGAVLLFVSLRAFVNPTKQTVYPIYSTSSQLWWSSGEVYEPHRPTEVPAGYRYAPTCAILLAPFALLPDSIGGVLWRLFSAAALVGSLAWFARNVLPTMNYSLILLLVIPLSLQSINNGQANIVVIAAMLGAVAAVMEERWNLASLLIAVAFIFKLYPLALGLTMMLLWPRRLGWRIPVFCLASLLLPFVGQHPGYVIDQSEKWFALIRAEDRSEIPLNDMYRDLWLLIHLYGMPMSRSIYVMLQLAGGALVALVCWHRQRAGWPTAGLLTSTLALTTAWMMLLGPATESSSFALLAPSFAWSIATAWNESPRTIRHGLLWCSCALFVVAVGLGGVAKDWGIHEAGVHVWASLFYFGYLLTEPRATASAVSPTRERGMSEIPRLRVGLSNVEVCDRDRT